MNHVGPTNLMSNVCCAVGNNSKMHTNKQTTEFYTCLCDGLDLDRSIQVVLEATNWVKKKTTSSLLSMSKLLQSQPLGLGKLSFITLSWTTGFLKLSAFSHFLFFPLFSFLFFISICMFFFFHPESIAQLFNISLQKIRSFFLKVKVASRIELR